MAAIFDRASSWSSMLPPVASGLRLATSRTVRGRNSRDTGQKFPIYSNTQDEARLAKSATLLTLTVKVPQPTRSSRAVALSADNGPLGTAELDRRGLDAAPEEPSPTPALLRR
jgi:hypothetical protein